MGFNRNVMSDSVNLICVGSKFNGTGFLKILAPRCGINSNSQFCRKGNIEKKE